MYIYVTDIRAELVAHYYFKDSEGYNTFNISVLF